MKYDIPKNTIIKYDIIANPESDVRISIITKIQSPHKIESNPRKGKINFRASLMQ
jgi:hypothetical protein